MDDANRSEGWRYSWLWSWLGGFWPGFRKESGGCGSVQQNDEEEDAPDGSFSKVLKSTVDLFETSNQYSADSSFSLHSSREVIEALVDVFEEADRLRVVAVLPGMDPDEAGIELREDVLVISAKSPSLIPRKEVPLPARFLPEQLKRTSKDGVLEITLELDRERVPRFDSGREELSRVQPIEAGR